MEITYTILFAFGAAIFGYLIGGIPTARIIAYSKGVDILKVGSKNAGGTNVGRSVGRWWGYLTRFLDRRKCFFPCLFVHLILSFANIPLVNYLWLNELLVCITGLSVAIGHSYSIYSKFKGGKAVSVFCGFAIATCWLAVLVGVIVFFVSLKIKKYVSLSSMLTAVSGIITTWIMFFLPILFTDFSSNIFMWGNGTFLVAGWEYATTITVMAIILIIRHSANIKRLVNHEERKISWMK